MRFLRDATPFTQVLFTLIMILMGGILVSMVGFLVCRIGMGISFDDLSGMLANVSEPANVSLLKFFQVLQSLGMFILPPVFIAYSLDDKPFQFLRLTARPAWRMLGSCLWGYPGNGPVIEWVSLLNQQLVLPSWLGSLESWMRSSEDKANRDNEVVSNYQKYRRITGQSCYCSCLSCHRRRVAFREYCKI